MRTRLMRSKFTLLFLTVAVLLAVAGTAMALTTDTSGNTSPAPTIQSDKADYAPGELVTLTGSNWQPGESVHINVNDTYGATWSRNVDVTADASGNITDSFNLPNSFVSDYDVTATGAQSGTVRTTFTDSNPNKVTVASPTNVSVTQGSNANYGTVTVEFKGDPGLCTVVLGVGTQAGDTGLPAGAFPVFSPPLLTGDKNDTKTSTFAVSTTNSTLAGTYKFHVKATRTGPDCNGSGDTFSDQQLTLVVNSGDTTAPTTSASATKATTPTASPYTFGDWSNKDVSVTLNATDNSGGSGVKEIRYTTNGVDPTASSGTVYSGPFQISSEGTTTVKFRAIDNAGNVEAVQSRTVKIDKTAPTITGSRTPAANGAGWNNSDVTVHFTCNDALSGVDSNGCPQDVVVSSEGANQSRSGTVTDAAGNTASTTVGNINIDKTAPTINASRTPAANANNWNNSDVTVHFTCSDALSGLDGSCPADVVVSSEGANQSVTKSVTDKAGNTASATQNDINIDKTNPNISASVLNQPDANTGWYNISTGGPQVHFDCSDALSGIAAGACPADHTVTDEGPSVNYSGSVSDRATNSASANAGPFKIDLTAPDVAGAPDLLASSDSGTSNIDNLTNDKTPTFDITAEAGSTVKLYAKKDGVETLIGQATATSGVATITSNQDLADGTYQVYAHVIDLAGNVSDTNAINITIVTIDATAPGAPGLDMDASSDTGVSDSDDKTMNDKPKFNGTAEAGSTLKLYDGANLLTTTTVGSGGTWSFTLTTALSEGTHQIKATATDAANNTSSEGQLSVVIDKTAPTISATLTPATPAASGWYNISTGAPKASYTCGDTLSGLNGACPGVFTFGDGSNLSHSETISDQAGNEATATVSNIKVDLTTPTQPTFQGIANTTYPVANVPAQSAISCSATDVTSPPATCVVDFTGYGNAFGSHTLTATATDQAGNTNTATLTYIVGLQAGEVLSPINSTGKANPAATNLDSFKIKSTIPVKFQLFNDTNKTQLMTSPPAGSVAKLTLFKQDNDTTTSDLTDTLTGLTPNTDNIFRWSATDSQYVYNLGTSTKNTAGTYGVQLTLYASNGTTVLAQSAKYYFVLRS
jgi:hypothetical protein